MKLQSAFVKTIFLVAAFAILQPLAASACAICYGEPDSPMTNGLTWAILALALVVGCVLTGVVAFFVHANRSTANEPPSAEASVPATTSS